MIDEVLQNNVFCFNGKVYDQNKGVAVGSKLGRNYVCAHMRKFDVCLMERQENLCPVADS